MAAWLAFGIAGLATGAVWATGFVAVGGADGSNGASPGLVMTPGDDHTPLLDNVVTKGSDLTYNWAGRWGAVVDTNLVKVDLDAKAPAEQFNVALLLTNPLDLGTSGWTTIQLAIELSDAVAGVCDGSTGANPVTKVMKIESNDAGVYFNSLAGDAVYCINVQTSPGTDELGTFLRRATDGVLPTAYPEFVTTVDYAA